ncbi:MAG: hypothetical protein LBC83_00100 [Oscillospiraceae bacterium]|jgi:hypothetical protein|nr:hypothetical protein [Oscillospiraceae bacterium]
MVKRCCSCFLAVALALLLALPALGAARRVVVPEVFVPGWGHTVYMNKGTPEERAANFVSIENLAFAMGQVFRGFFLAALRCDWDYAADGLSAIFFSIFGEMLLDARGNSIHPISDPWSIDPAQDYTERPEFYFGYDFRMDPMESGRQLNDFIQAVKAQTGRSKVAVISESEGACVVMAYLAQFGTADLDAMVLQIGAFNGLELVGQLFKGEVHVDAQALVNYLCAYVPDESGAFRFFLQALKSLGVIDAVVRPVEYGVLPNIQRRLFDICLLPIFGHFAALWTFVPADDFDEAKAYLFNGREGEYTKLIGEIDAYHSAVGMKTEQLLLGARADGVRVALMVGYNNPAMPFTPYSNYQGDGLIDTAHSSAGATVAPYGETLANTAGKYAAPDGCIDASTCVLPDTTWFFKNSGHSAGAMRELRDWFVQSETAYTVFSDARFPQYMININGAGVPQ